MKQQNKPLFERDKALSVADFYLIIGSKISSIMRNGDKRPVVKRGGKMNPEAVTIEECMENYYRKGRRSILSDGKYEGYEEEIPTQTANPSGDNK